MSPPKQPKQKKQRTVAGDIAAVGRIKTSSASGPLQCAVCNRQFSRPSHHDRHYRTHLPPEGRLALPCNRCGKAFGRNDVLLRHLRTAHGVDPGPQPKAAQKSCYRCVHLRRKCDRQQPCRLCAAGGAVCQYPQNESRTTTATTTQKAEVILTTYMAADPNSMTAQQNPAHIVISADGPQPLFHGSSHGNGDGGYNAHQTTFGDGLSSVDVMDVTASVSAADNNSAPYLDGPSNSGTGMPTNGCSPSFSDEYYLAADTTPFVASLSAAGQLDFRTAGLDWLDFDVPDIFSTADSTGMAEIDTSLASQQQPQPLYHSQEPHYQPQQQSHPPPPPPQQPQQHHQQHPHHQHPHPHSHSNAQQPPQPQHLMDRPPSSQYVNYSANPHPGYGGGSTGPHAAGSGAGPHPSSTSVLPWPFDDTPDNLAPRCYSLPPLREVLQNTLSQSTNPTPPNKSVLANLVALMSDTRMPQAVDGASDDTDESSSAHPEQQKPSNNNNTPMAMAINTMDPGMAHAANLLKRLVDTYVAKFQPILPLLHVPTWDLGACPPVLVSAMACVGSLLSDDERVAGLTWSISDICMPMIAWLGSSDSANYRDIAYLSALCVHQIYSLGSGNRQLYQNADRTRGILVGGLRGMGCLTTRLSLEDKLEQEQNSTARDSTSNSTATHPSTPTLPVDPATQHEQWMAWVRREREKRTAWSSFEYDCSLCTLTGRRGAVDLSELPSRLPCAETLWDAPSATAWAALRTRLHPDAQGAPVSLVLKAALSEEEDDVDEDMDDEEDEDDGDDIDNNDNGSHDEEDDSDDSIGGSGTYVETDRDTPRVSMRATVKTKTARKASTSKTSPQVSFWGKRLCAQVIGRLLWDLKQLETLSSSEYFGMPSLSTAHAANKVRLLRALDHLLVSMDQPATVADLISYNIASLIGHYSHLYTAQDVLDIILYIVRNTVAHGARKLQYHKGIQMAKRRLVATLSRDPQEARRLVYHAAQIVAVANDYLVSAPCEILRLFMGYTFLIVFAAYCPSSHRFQAATAPAQSVMPQTQLPPGLSFGSAMSSLPLSSPMPPSMLPPAAHVGGVTSAGASATIAAIQLDIPSHRIASTADVDNWIAHGGPAAIGSVPNLFADGGALAISRDAQAMLQRLKCWGLAEKFTKILQSFETTALVGSQGQGGHAQGQAQSHTQT